jgi:transposase
MEITREQYEKIAASFSRQRGNVKFDNLLVFNAILYVAENGCKWRGLPERFGNWHSIYTRMSRWSKNGVLDRIFKRLQQEQIIRINMDAVSLDSTIIKVHPDGTGALKKKWYSVCRQIMRRLDNKNSSDCGKFRMRSDIAKAI